MVLVLFHWITLWLGIHEIWVLQNVSTHWSWLIPDGFFMFIQFIKYTDQRLILFASNPASHPSGCVDFIQTSFGSKKATLNTVWRSFLKNTKGFLECEKKYPLEEYLVTLGIIKMVNFILYYHGKNTQTLKICFPKYQRIFIEVILLYLPSTSLDMNSIRLLRICF